ncbi:uncharacterized protein METZ01_LOCUS19145 [marine metagenome]|uniref:Uncharacterized protein n=1 Tax=marine metagenome TaxID=408172 RepID=A0A381PH10_9ZZZZ
MREVIFSLHYNYQLDANFLCKTHDTQY